MEQVKNYNELVAHKSNFDAENMKKVGFQKLAVCSEQVFSTAYIWKIFLLCSELKWMKLLSRI